MKSSAAGLRTLTVRGTSMLPLLPQGTHVLLDGSVPASSLRRGDIVAFRHPATGRRLIHRVIGFSAGSLIHTKGDHERREDPPWPASLLIGRLVAVRVGRAPWSVPRPWTSSLLPAVLSLRPTRLGLILASLLILWLPAHRPFAHPEKRMKQGLPREPMPSGEAAFEVQELGNEVAVYDHRNGALHMLNRTAAAIWAMAREGQSTESIARALGEQFTGTETGILARDIEATLSELKSLNIL